MITISARSGCPGYPWDMLKKLLSLTLFTVLLSSGAWAEGLLVHLGHFSDDLHAASMAVKVATVAAQDGQKVVLFTDREGVRLVDKRQPLDLQWGGSAPLSMLFDNFIKSGGKVMVCPHCAQAIGLEEANLREGAELLDAETMARMLKEADKIIDY